ncbi:hypothetical protein PLIIFM63780_002170 [Purpureocillium lilacinum]|nr:hypothetical protein PLIIFM63780_002170 [Purpureocillium lilacinum]
MSDRYVISVENRRGANTNYAVFMDPPEFSGGQQPFMNVWYTSFVPYQGAIVNSGMSLLANLGSESSPGSTFDLKIQQGFPTITQVTPTAIPGAFEIDTGSDFTVPNSTYLVGLAKVNHRGQVAPVASMAPMNNMKIQVIPTMKFFITESQQVPGEIVDYSSVTREGATIDFSSGEGQGNFYARVIQQNDGRFEVNYFGTDMN